MKNIEIYQILLKVVEIQVKSCQKSVENPNMQKGRENSKRSKTLAT